MTDLMARLARLTGHTATRFHPLSGGCVGEVYHCQFRERSPLVVKVGSPTSCLDIEGRMLDDLRQQSTLPVPKVVHAEKDLLVMEYIANNSRGGHEPDIHAAQLLKRLHQVTSPNHKFGYDYDTLIGGIPQPNSWTETWIEFFRRQRLLYMAKMAKDIGRITESLYEQILCFADGLENFLTEPQAPALLHGDIWSGNVLIHDGRVAAFIDPAIYYGHPEIELAFITMFSTFGDDFFNEYGMPDKDFFEVRRPIYNLYPLLVHAYLFGGVYTSQIAATLKRYRTN